jgi:hypothetical protein
MTLLTPPIPSLALHHAKVPVRRIPVRLATAAALLGHLAPAAVAGRRPAVGRGRAARRRGQRARGLRCDALLRLLVEPDELAGEVARVDGRRREVHGFRQHVRVESQMQEVIHKRLDWYG